MEAASMHSHSLSQTVVRGSPGVLLHPLTLWGKGLYCSLSPVAPWAAPLPVCGDSLLAAPLLPLPSRLISPASWGLAQSNFVLGSSFAGHSFMVQP